jgi:hypothetical protein
MFCIVHCFLHKFFSLFLWINTIIHFSFVLINPKFISDNEPIDEIIQIIKVFGIHMFMLDDWKQQNIFPINIGLFMRKSTYFHFLIEFVIKESNWKKKRYIIFKKFLNLLSLNKNMWKIGNRENFYFEQFWNKLNERSILYFAGDDECASFLFPYST